MSRREKRKERRGVIEGGKVLHFSDLLGVSSSENKGGWQNDGRGEREENSKDGALRVKI